MIPLRGSAGLRLGLAAAALLAVSGAAAQVATRCTVGVKLINASKRTEVPMKKLHVSSFLSDVGNQLEPLPFSEYAAIDAAEQNVEVREPCSFALQSSPNEDHRVTVLPHDLTSGKVTTTVTWTGPDGAALVSTKMRVVNGESVMIGAEKGHDSSTLLSVRTTCGSDAR